MFCFNRRRLYEEDNVNRIQIKLELYGLGFVHTETAWYLNYCLSLMMYAVSLKTNQKKKKKHFLDSCVFLLTTSRNHRKFIRLVGGSGRSAHQQKSKSYENTEPPHVAGTAGEGKECCTYINELSR